MKKVNLNLIPVQIEQGIITKKEAVDKISTFVYQNYLVFGLQKYDEDFRSNIVLDILERGQTFLDGFTPERGDFFTYLYYQIKSLVHARTRTAAKKNLETSVTLSETITMAEEKDYKYKTIDYSTIDHVKYVKLPKVPYSAAKQKITPEELRKTFENVHGDKKLLVIAIKSAYYITDNQVEKICNHYNINENDFFNTIEYCRNTLTNKAEKKLKLQERRNSAYLHHKNLETQIHSFKNNKTEKDSFIAKDFIEKEKKYHKSWEELNRRLESGILALRPTNKTIAELLGICERQVAYYIKCVKEKNQHYNLDAAGDEIYS